MVLPWQSTNVRPVGLSQNTSWRGQGKLSGHACTCSPPHSCVCADFFLVLSDLPPKTRKEERKHKKEVEKLMKKVEKQGKAKV